MEKERIIDFLEKTKKHLTDENTEFLTGLCKAFKFVFFFYKELTDDEFEFLMLYLSNHKPTPYNQYNQFTQNEFWCDNYYWWHPIWKVPETRQIRIDYIQEIINNLNNIIQNGKT